MYRIRIARPVSDLARPAELYCRGLGLHVVGGFEDHQGFDGVMLGSSDPAVHFEFTHHRLHAVPASPTAEDLVVFYVPEQTEWQALCERMKAAGFTQVTSFNPYWEVRGRTFQDFDGYRIVVQCDEWRAADSRAQQQWS